VTRKGIATKRGELTCPDDSSTFTSIDGVSAEIYGVAQKERGTERKNYSRFTVISDKMHRLQAFVG